MTVKVVLTYDPVKVPEELPGKVSSLGVELISYTNAMTNAELISACRDADYIITTPGLYNFPAPVLQGLQRCRFIQSISIGYDNVDIKVATELGIGVINLRGNMTQELSEHAFALMMECARWIITLNNRIKSRRPVVPFGTEALQHMSTLKGKTLGILGFGDAGRAMVPKARGFDMKILAYDPFVDDSTFQTLDAERVDLERLLKESDFISIHAGLTPENAHMLGLQQLKMMKRTAFIINTARGILIDQEALYTALAEGYIAGVGLDVTDPEPVPDNSPLLKFDNVILTGHQAGTSMEASLRITPLVLNELSRVLRGEWPLALVNPGVKLNYKARWGESPLVL